MLRMPKPMYTGHVPWIERGFAMAGLWEPVGGVYTASASWWPNLDFLEKLSNSPLLIAVVGGLLGAGFGAWAAGRIAKRSKQHDAINTEIRNTNLAMLLAQQAFNIGLGLKVSAIKPLTDAYTKARSEYLDPVNGGKVSETQNLQKISPINPPVEALRTIVLEKLTLKGPAIRAGLEVVDAVHCLNRTLTVRNELADMLLHNQLPRGMNFEHMYFGIEKDGHRHEGYSDTIRDIARFTDDLLFFSMTLCQHLDERGVELGRRCKKLGMGEVSTLRFRLADDVVKGMIPSAEPYRMWLDRFQEEVGRKKWWPVWSK
ncbi:hypothetical protein ACIPZF_09185 [Pseudomonas sp. NPDC089752]|uniref:hypothetical protein n=1 Tax=Pseudomonas sp. NPDC089752 TaxID=3364472 RepID=UPI003825FD97